MAKRQPVGTVSDKRILKRGVGNTMVDSLNPIGKTIGDSCRLQESNCQIRFGLQRDCRQATDNERGNEEKQPSSN